MFDEISEGSWNIIAEMEGAVIDNAPRCSGITNAFVAFSIVIYFAVPIVFIKFQKESNGL